MSRSRPAATLGYRLHKFVRRHKVPVLAAVAVVLALIGGIVGTTWGLIRQAREDHGPEMPETGRRNAPRRKPPPATRPPKPKPIPKPSPPSSPTAFWPPRTLKVWTRVSA